MHALDLARLACTFTRQASVQLSLRCPAPKNAVHSYWLTNRFRQEYWSSRLSAHRVAIQRHGVSFRNRCWHEIIPVIQEVLLSEPLTRCVAYYGTALEEMQTDFDAGPLLHSALDAHIESRNRCLHLIVFGAGLSVENAVRLNRLRRWMETFSDQLLVAMRPIKNLQKYSFDPDITLAAQREYSLNSNSSACLKLHTCALSDWLSTDSSFDVDGRSASPRLNYRLSQSILEMFDGKAFDSFGTPRTHEDVLRTLESSESDAKQDAALAPHTSPHDLVAVPKTRDRLARATPPPRF